MEEGLHKLWQGVTPAIYRHIGKSIFIFVSKCLALLYSAPFRFHACCYFWQFCV